MSHAGDEQGKAPADTSARRKYARRLTRGACLLAAAVILSPWLIETEWPLYVAALSPWVAMCSALALRALPFAACLGLAVGLMAVLRRRWFCRWVCPTGLCADAASRVGRTLRLRGRQLPPVGLAIALITLAGAGLGYPLLLFLDPLAMLSGACTVMVAPAAAWWGALGVAAVLLLSLLMPGSWCARFCPLGATQELLCAKRGRESFSPSTRELLRGQSTRTTPDLVSRTPWRLARRVVLGGLAGAAWAALAKRTRADVPPTLRPPGARGTGSERRSGPEFVGLCIRCGNCVRACPAKIIEPDRSSPGIAGLLAPIIRFAHDYCREDCTRCTAVCPSGALRPLALPEKRRTPIGLPRVDMDVCLLGDDHDCAVCRSFCPFEAIKLVFSEADHTLTPQIDAARCPGCGACQVACPTQPRKAIVVYPLGE